MITFIELLLLMNFSGVTRALSVRSDARLINCFILKETVLFHVVSVLFDLDICLTFYKLCKR